MTQAEKNAIATFLASCPAEPLPAGEVVDVPERRPAPAPAPAPAPVQERAPVVVVPAPAPAPAPSTYYKNCTAAKDAGAAPVRVGDPGYGTHLDRDGDGIGCEN